MTFCSKDKQSAKLRNTGSKFNIGTASGHVRRNCHGARLSRAHDNLSFLHVKFRVQHVVRDFFTLQHSTEQFGSFHADRADQYRLLLCVMFPDLVDHCVVFFATSFVDAVVVIFARHRPIRRDHVHVQFVNVVEFGRFRFGRASHAGQFLIEPEIILDRDRGQRLRFAVDLDAFFRFNGLMQSIAPASPGHLAAGELIDNYHLVFLDDVLDVLLEQAIGAEQIRNVVDPLRLRIAMFLAL